MKTYKTLCILLLFGNISLQAQNVGIGVTTPTSTLDVNGDIRIRGGSPTAGKVLTSDNNGTATWTTPIQPKFVISDNYSDANLVSNGYQLYGKLLDNVKLASTIQTTPNTWEIADSFLKHSNYGASLFPIGIDTFLIYGVFVGANNFINNGGIYSAKTDSWVQINKLNDGFRRRGANTVWTGSKLFIWGGTYTDNTGNLVFINSGAIYDVATKNWTYINNVGAPSGRTNAAIVFNASTNEIAIWGGDNFNSVFNDGAKYNLTTNTWTLMSSTNAPTARTGTGFAGNNAGKMLISGGNNNNTYFNSSHLYDFVSNTWTTLNASGLSIRSASKVGYYNGKFIVWGGYNYDFVNYVSTNFNDGAVYTVAANTWYNISLTGAPSFTSNSNGAFANDYMYTIGLNGIGKYKISTNTWEILPGNEVRIDHLMGVSDNCMFIFDGMDNVSLNYSTNIGKRYFFNTQTIQSYNSNQLSELYLFKKN